MLRISYYISWSDYAAYAYRDMVMSHCPPKQSSALLGLQQNPNQLIEIITSLFWSQMEPPNISENSFLSGLAEDLVSNFTFSSSNWINPHLSLSPPLFVGEEKEGRGGRGKKRNVTFYLQTKVWNITLSWRIIKTFFLSQPSIHKYTESIQTQNHILKSVSWAVNCFLLSFLVHLTCKWA